MMSKHNALVDAIAGMREGDALELAERMLDAGADPTAILGCVSDAMAVVGRQFEQGEYFLPELILSGEIVSQLSDMIQPRMSGAESAARLGTVLIGTVQGDIHDLGKNIVTFMLEVNGFDVIDLGVDVSPERFVEGIRDHDPRVVALSALLTIAYDSMRRTVEAIRDAGQYDQVKIMVGGGHTTDLVRERSGAHAFGADAMAAVRLAKGWLEQPA